MNEHTVYSDEEAALIEAHTHACALAQRYGHACDVLLDDGDLKDRFEARRKELQTLSDELEKRIRARDLLPHDVNVDREDFARLADRFREWLDHERHSHLQRALADREADLIDRLERLLARCSDLEKVESGLADSRRALQQLERG